MTVLWRLRFVFWMWWIHPFAGIPLRVFWEWSEDEEKDGSPLSSASDMWYYMNQD